MVFCPPLPCPRSCKLALEHTGKVHAASPVTKDRDGKRVRWGAEGSPCMWWGWTRTPYQTSSALRQTFAPGHENHLHERGRLSKRVILMQGSCGVRGPRPGLPPVARAAPFLHAPRQRRLLRQKAGACLERRVTAPAACAACNHHVSCLSTAIDAAEAAIQTPGIRPPSTTLSAQLRLIGARHSCSLHPRHHLQPSQLNQPSRHGCCAVPSR